MSRRLHRRTLLRGGAGIAIALPFLEAMQTRRAGAQSSEAPQRFGIFFSANGVIDADWRPTGTETDFTLGASLAALAPHQSDIVVLHGLDAETSYMPNQSANEHDLSMSHMLTAMRIQGNQAGRAGHILDGTAGGPSIDQALAAEIGGETKLRSLELGVASTITDLEPLVIRMSYGGPGDPRTPMDDPQQVFTRLFGDGENTEQEIQTLHRQRRSVLDAVLSEFQSVDATLGYDDRQRLERHAAAIRDIENQLDLGDTSGCSVPSSPPDVSNELFDCVRDGRQNVCLASYTEIGKAQMDLMVLAFACDLSRVVSLQWSTAESTVVHSHLGITGEHHLMSHDLAQFSGELTQINTWYAEQFAYLLSELKAIPEGDGTLLDNLLLFWPNELSQGEVHSRRGLPYVLAGRAGGQLPTGRFLEYSGEPHNQLYTSFLNMFGVQATGFGEPDFPGTLAGLV